MSKYHHMDVCMCVFEHTLTHTYIYIYTHASIHPSMHTYISLQSHDVASTSPRDPPWAQGLRGHGKTQKTRNKCATLSRVPRVPRAFRAGTSLTVQIMVQWAWSNAYDGDWTDHGGVVFHEEWGTWWPGGKEDGWLNVSGWWKRSFCLEKKLVDWLWNYYGFHKQKLDAPPILSVWECHWYIHDGLVLK